MVLSPPASIYPFIAIKHNITLHYIKHIHEKNLQNLKLNMDVVDYDESIQILGLCHQPCFRERQVFWEKILP